MERPKCETCLYWECLGVPDDPEADDYHPAYGECHRNAPVSRFLGKQEPRGTDWPIVTQGEWCGEHPDFPAYVKSLRLTTITP